MTAGPDAFRTGRGLVRLVTRRVPLSAGAEAPDREPDGVGTGVTLQD